jgi:hypothetical protein
LTDHPCFFAGQQPAAPVFSGQLPAVLPALPWLDPGHSDRQKVNKLSFQPTWVHHYTFNNKGKVDGWGIKFNANFIKPNWLMH